MIRKTLVAFAVLLIMVFAGCAELMRSTSEEYEIKRFVEDMNTTWKGKHIIGVVERMGRANSMIDDGKGGHVLIWIESTQVTKPQYSYESVPQDNTPIYTPLPRREQGTVTEGEMRWNPYLEKWEWKSKTHDITRYTPNPLGAVQQAQTSTPPTKRLVTKYTTQTRIYHVMFFVNADGIIYDCNLVKR